MTSSPTEPTVSSASPESVTELTDLARFVAVAEDLHFGRAAARLNLSQPALSQTIRRLEDAVGFELLVRSTRSVELSAAGRVFYEETRRTLWQADRAVSLARAVIRGDTGHLTVGYPPAALDTAATVLSGFTRVCPGIRVDHRQEYTITLIDDVGAGLLDAAIIVSQPLPGSYAKEPLRDLPLCCTVGKTHPLASAPSIPFSAVDGWALAMVDAPRHDAWHEILQRLCEYYDISVEFRAIGDPFGRLEEILSDGETIWLAPEEYPSNYGVTIPISPRIMLPVDLIWRREHEKPQLELLAQHARQTRKSQAWLSDRSLHIARYLSA
jgi:DNA-binding transcriptional LysR family regulator